MGARKKGVGHIPDRSRPTRRWGPEKRCSGGLFGAAGRHKEKGGTRQPRETHVGSQSGARTLAALAADCCTVMVMLGCNRTPSMLVACGSEERELLTEGSAISLLRSAMVVIVQGVYGAGVLR
jgi:hypothetical protein